MSSTRNSTVLGLLAVMASCGPIEAQHSSGKETAKFRRPEYNIQRVKTEIKLDGRLDESAWRQAPVISDFHFPWWKEGKKETTEARLLWDDTHLYIAHICQDEHITARYTEHDDPVAKDDCFEVMVAPNVLHADRYFNIEWNVRGAYIDGHRKNGPKRPSVKWDADGIRVAGRYDGTVNDDSDTDRTWTCEVAIPFSNFDEYTGKAKPSRGDRWHLNLNRHGGDVNLQYSQWSPGDTPKPSFHTPHRFGRVTFVE